MAHKAFPAAARPVASIVSPRWSSEEARDRLHEATEVMRRAGIAPGMTVADIGAGEGYYTVRLAARVGKEGRVLAEDIVPAVRDALADRIARDQLDNVSVRLGLPADPRLPRSSFDRIFLIHMYHEIARPYEFLWRVRPSLRAGGKVVVVDANRPTQNHGTPAGAARLRDGGGGLQPGCDDTDAVSRRLSRGVRGYRPPPRARNDSSVRPGWQTRANQVERPALLTLERRSNRQPVARAEGRRRRSSASRSARSVDRPITELPCHLQRLDRLPSRNGLGLLVPIATFTFCEAQAGRIASVVVGR